MGELATCSAPNTRVSKGNLRKELQELSPSTLRFFFFLFALALGASKFLLPWIWVCDFAALLMGLLQREPHVRQKSTSLIDHSVRFSAQELNVTASTDAKKLMGASQQKGMG